MIGGLTGVVAAGIGVGELSLAKIHKRVVDQLRATIHRAHLIGEWLWRCWQCTCSCRRERQQSGTTNYCEFVVPIEKDEAAG